MSQGSVPAAAPKDRHGRTGEVRSFMAPLVAMGAVWGVKQALNKGYAAKTGQAPPKASNNDVPIAHVVLWAGFTAIAVAFVDVAVERYFAKQKPKG